MQIFLKDLWRTIKNSWGRFFAIAGICALGIGFFSGLQMTCGDMKSALNDYYDNTNMMDVRVVGSMGLSQSCIDSLKNICGVEGVMPAYETDILTNFGSDQTVIKLHSLCESAYISKCIDNQVISDDKDYINRLILTKGDWPKKDNECVLSVDTPSVNKPEIGDQIDILECSNDIDKTINFKNLKVTGYVKSSYYVNIVQMGNSNLGRGTVNQYAYVSSDFFNKDMPYTEAFLTIDGAKDYIYGTQEYQDFIDNAMVNIATASPQIAKIRTSEIKSNAQEKLNEAQQEFDNQKHTAMEELNANEEKLKDAWDQIEMSKEPIKQGQEQLDAGYAEFFASKNAVLTPIYDGINFLEPKVNLTVDLSNKHESLISQFDTYSMQVQNINIAPAGLTNTIDLLEQEILIDDKALEIINSLPEPNPLLILSFETYKNASLQFKNFCQAFLSDISAHPEKFDEDLASFNSQYTQYKFYLSSKTVMFSILIEPMQTSLNELYQGLNTALSTFNELEKPLIEAQKQLDSANIQLQECLDSYYDGLNKFLDAKTLAFAKFAEAELKLNQSQSDINKIEDSELFIMDRSKNYGAINFKNDSERIANIANIFPLMFFFVALLVALTSMTRMIDEERITIGTYKALGFSRKMISQKYILYGFISSFAGSVIGVLILAQFLPWVIMYAYSIMYKLPIPFPMSYDLFIAAISIGVGVAITLGSTIFASAKSLKMIPALLMQPSAPKAGKRILLEYISPVWKVITFNWKITLRNMFLYKRRLFMTVIGIAGCCALLLTGFGLHDSISDILDKQFDSIVYYNYKASSDTPITDEQKAQLQELSYSADQNFNSTLIHEENLLAQPEGFPNQSTILFVPHDIDSFQSLINLNDRKTKEHFSIDESGVLITEKLANMLGVKKGDTVTLYNQDFIGNAGTDEYSFKISGVVENYIAHYIYMSPVMYKNYFNKDCTYESYIAQINIDDSSKDVYLEKSNNIENIKTSFFNDTNRDTYDQMLSSVNMVVVILILSAAILAFVVLYNLININICERLREIATLKVLGMKPIEINFYIHRETFILSALGCLAGILLGFVMENFVILSAEVDYVMFGRQIYWWSIALSVGITMVFTILVTLFMRKKLSSISMVESLKSIE